MEYVDQLTPHIAALPLSLVVISAVAGVVMMLLFKVASNPGAIQRAKRRVQAQLLALRLFGDEPALVWRAQLRLLAGNARYIAVMLIPILAAAVPFLLAFPHLEALYGRAALPVGSETLLTVRVRAAEAGFRQPRLEMPSGLRVDTPPVRIHDAAGPAGEISWRIAAAGWVSGPVRIDLGDAAVTKTVQVGSAHGYVDETRPAGMLSWLFDPGEAPIPAADFGPGIEWVRVVYPAQRLSALGLEWPWEGWFIAISVITALLVKSRFGVVF